MTVKNIAENVSGLVRAQ